MKARCALVVAGFAAATACKQGSRAPAASSDERQDAGAGERAAAPRPHEIAVLTGVSIRWTDSERPAGIADDELSRRLRAILVGSPPFLSQAEPVPVGRVPVPAAVTILLHREVAAPPPGARPTARALLVGVEAELAWKRGDRLRPRENVLMHRPLERQEAAELDALTATMTGEALEEAAQGLIQKEALRQGDDAAVLAALAASDPDEVLWALDLAADRHLPAAFDRAVALLDARDPGVQAAALRLLVALRDPRAVRPLARRADFADPDTMRALVEAVTAIGGPEAIEFLELVAGGHADPDMRGRAEEGLERLGRQRP